MVERRQKCLALGAADLHPITVDDGVLVLDAVHVFQIDKVRLAAAEEILRRQLLLHIAHGAGGMHLALLGVEQQVVVANFYIINVGDIELLHAARAGHREEMLLAAPQQLPHMVHPLAESVITQRL